MEEYAEKSWEEDGEEMWTLSRQEEAFFWGEEGEVGKAADYESGEGASEKGHMSVGAGMGAEGMYPYSM